MIDNCNVNFASSLGSYQI